METTKTITFFTFVGPFPVHEFQLILKHVSENTEIFLKLPKFPQISTPRSCIDMSH